MNTTRGLRHLRWYIAGLLFLALQFAWNVWAQFSQAGGGVAYMAHLSGYVFGIGIAAWGIGRLGITPSFLDVAAYAVLCACAVVTCYALWFSSVLGAFWAGRLQNAGAIFEPVVSMARVPTTSLARA